MPATRPAASLSMPWKEAMMSTWWGISKSGTTGSPKRSTSTLWVSSGPMGTEGSMMLGIVYMISRIFASSSCVRTSSAARRSSSCLTAALLRSICAWIPAFSSSEHFLRRPKSGPFSLESLLRAAFSCSTSWMDARFSWSRRMTSSTSGSFASWNFLRIFSRTASGLSRRNLISIMFFLFLPSFAQQFFVDRVGVVGEINMQHLERIHGS